MRTGIDSCFLFSFVFFLGDYESIQMVGSYIHDNLPGSQTCRQVLAS